MICLKIQTHFHDFESRLWNAVPTILDTCTCLLDMLRDRSQTLVRGDWCKKYRENFSGPPSDRKKKKKKKKKNSGPPFFAMKITGQPHRKACKLNF